MINSQRPKKDNQRGIALLIVLWALTILMVTVFSFSVMTRAETFSLLAFREGTENKFRAEAGIDRGIMEIIYRSINQSQTEILAGREVWRLDGTAYDITDAEGGYLVRIIDETGKLSLNGLTDASGIVLKNLLINQGVSPDNADIIADSILDWKDADDLHRLHGAEDDYYQSLPKPYKARNANFETLDELIMVRGITTEILYGHGKTKGIIHFLSLQNNAAQVNVNCAPQEVLAALPGMNAAMVKAIMEFRATAEIRGIGDVKDIIGDSYPLMAPYAVFAAAGAAPAYTVEATGYRGARKNGYSILATVALDSPQKYRYIYYKSPVEIMP